MADNAYAPRDGFTPYRPPLVRFAGPSFLLGVCHDNIGYTAGAGTSVATDTISAVEYQRVKLAMGPDGTFSADAQTPSADALATTTALLVALGLLNGTTLDRLRSIDAFKAAAGTPDVGLLAAIHADRRYSNVTVATTASTTVISDAIGAAQAIILVSTTTTGTFKFQVSPDGTTFVDAETYDVATDTWVTTQALTPTSGKVYRILLAGMKVLKVLVVATLGATVTITQPIAAATSSLISAVDTGPAPHSFGYTPVNYDGTFTTAQTSVAIASNAVAATQRLVITSIQIQSYGTTAGTCIVYFGTGAFSRGTSKAVFDGEFAPQTTQKPGFAMTFPVNPPIGAADEELRITTTNAQSVTVNAWGYLIAV